MKILVLHGPNLNVLGQRDSSQYGVKTLDEINQELLMIAVKQHITLEIFQSNHEGALIDTIQKSRGVFDGILINPGALTHYGYSLRDALEDSKLPIVEVHLSEITKREAFRKINVLDGIVVDQIVGLKDQSYIKGLIKLLEVLS